MELIPLWARKLWDAWDARIMITLSLIFQIILSVFGSSRKCTKSIKIRILVWMTYLLADSVATIALGKLSFVGGDVIDPNRRGEVRILWAPLLLLHLGGPDSITAFALEDNELWLRHLLGLGVQVVVAIYVILKFWEFHWFTFLSFPILVSGIIKYGERTWALKSASGSQQKVPMGGSGIETINEVLSDDPRPHVETSTLVWAHKYFRIFKPYIASYVSTKKVSIWNAPHLLQLGQPNVTLQWTTVEVEMGLMYDMLYTKSPIIYTRAGFIIRCITFSCTAASLMGFLLAIFVDPKSRIHNYWTIDIAISGVLLVAAFVLEIYAALVLLSSDWTKIWIIKHRDQLVRTWLFRKYPSWLAFPMQNYKDKRRWSSKMGQFSLLSFCLHGKHDKPVMLGKILSCFGIDEDVDKYWQKTIVDVPLDLKNRIIEFLFKESTAPIIDGKTLQVNLLWGVEGKGWIHKKDIEERIIIWHLATELCYLHPHSESGSNTNNSDTNGRETCKCLSHYMMYLIVMCPSILPVPTYATDSALTPAIEQFKKILADGNIRDIDTAYVRYEEIFGRLGGDGGNHETEMARIALDLVEFLETKEDIWEILCFVWLDMLCYAASWSLRNNHIVHLAGGGELVTLVWLLITQSDIKDIGEKFTN